MMTVEKDTAVNSTKETILKLRKAGYTLEEIGITLDMSRQGVDDHLRKTEGFPAKEANRVRMETLAIEVTNLLDALVSEIANEENGSPDDVFRLFSYKGVYPNVKPHKTKSGFFNWLRRLGLEPHWWGLIRLSGASGEWSAEEIESWRDKFRGNPEHVARVSEEIKALRQKLKKSK